MRSINVESNKKTIQKNLFTKQKQRFQNQTQGYQRENTGERDKLGDWDKHIYTYTHIHTIYIKQISNEDLPHSTGKSTQYCVITYMGKESEKEMDICMIDLLLYLKLT